MLCVSARSATNIQGRPVLRKLLADAHGELVDLILVKSISRLSRNTVVLLIIVRELKLIGVEIFFEKESLLVPMQSALNAWKIPTFADCFFNLCLFVLFENFGCKNLKHTIFEPLKLLFSLL